jgi:hypothetical protein
MFFILQLFCSTLEQPTPFFLLKFWLNYLWLDASLLLSQLWSLVVTYGGIARQGSKPPGPKLEKKVSGPRN